MDWKIYYGDGSSISDAEIENVSARNVMCIVQFHPEVGKRILARSDYYWFDEEWQCGDIFGLFDYLIEPGYKKVLFGRTIVSKEYDEILKRALNDEDFPIKSATLPREKF